MNIFQEIKDHITAKEVAAGYGLAISPKGMTCCPFHDDRHPSMKIDTFYYCFTCGAKGDAINYVARRYSLRPYDAAKKIIEDFHLPIPLEKGAVIQRTAQDYRRQREQAENKQVERIKKRFHKWKLKQIDKLKVIRAQVDLIKDHYRHAPPEIVFASEEYRTAVMAEPVIDYWLDILCLGEETEQQQFFKENRKEVTAYGERIGKAVQSLMERDRADHG